MIHNYEMAYGVYGNAVLSVGDVSVISNTITGTRPLYLWNDAVGYEMADNATATLGKTRIADNTLMAPAQQGFIFARRGLAIT